MSSASEPVALPAFPTAAGDAPAYVQIERWLDALIGSGDLAAGDRLPNERDLAAHVGVSRMTLRRALDALERAGSIRRAASRNGGAFVAEGRVLVDLGVLPGLAAQIRRSHLVPGGELRAAEVRTAPQAVRAALAVADDHAYYVERIRRAGGREIAIERSWLPLAIADDLLDQDLTGSLYEVLETYGRKPVEAKEYIAPVVDDLSGELLGCPPGHPLLHVRRTALDANRIPVEYSEDVFRPDRVQLMVVRRLD